MKLKTFEVIIKALNTADVRYLVVGGMAVVAHGYGRLTIDIDFVIQLSRQNITRAFSALDSIGYHSRVPVTADEFADDELRDSLIKEKNMTVLPFSSEQYPDTPIDIFVREPFNFDECYAGAYTEDVAENVPVKFVDLQTLLRMKREAGRDKDHDDVAHLLMIQKDAGDE